MTVQVLAEVADGAAVRQRDPDQHLNGGRLPSAVGPQQAHNAALLEAKAHAIHGPK